MHLAYEASMPLPNDDNESMHSTHEASMPLASESIHSTEEEGTRVVVPYKGQLFDTLEEAKGFYLEYARKVGFGVRTRDSRRLNAQANRVTQLHLTCDR